MKAMYTGFVAIIAISIVAYLALHQLGFSAQDVSAGANVRLE